MKNTFVQGNAAFKGNQWNKAAYYYTEAIKLNETNATYYCNRADAWLELGRCDSSYISCTIGCIKSLLRISLLIEIFYTVSKKLKRTAVKQFLWIRRCDPG